ncbi:hemerythrin family protein [Trichlorobacter lovleyi]|uniref:bacteriohemerythrin n=1 Tax=Trichlorobacter lovleyi TaxID=313985 RepID=UPI00223ED103|nr:bacteriohemerythrin [Trichlorobacter lovleyi]QOX77810.1 hemerythrin family protein [Trichlorobacter lovleyi]
MKIEWHPRLSTGHAEIDAHHREMFEKINELIDACKQGREKPVVLELLTFLQRYVQCHFAAEEEYLTQHGVPNRREHLRQHEELKKQLEKVRTDCAQEGTSLAVVTNSLKLTYVWLKDHIQVMDRSMVTTNAAVGPDGV